MTMNAPLASSQLAVMPLHAITEVHGQAGLAQRLTLELQRLPAADRRPVQDAANWAQELHAEQRRTREPYANHVLRVALRILCYYRVTDPDVLVAALLHDAVEDQPWATAGVIHDVPPTWAAVSATIIHDVPPTWAAVSATITHDVPPTWAAVSATITHDVPPPREAAFAAIAARYNSRVARLVAAVTNPDRPAGSGSDWRVLNRQYVENLASTLDAEPWARVLKLSDFTDNGVGLIHTVGPKVQRSARKYRGALPVLRDLLARPDTPLNGPVRAHINDQLDLAERRFAAILDA